MTLASFGKTAEEREEARIGLLTIIAGVIGFAAGLIAFALYHLIGFLTNLFFYQRLDVSFASPQYNHLGPLVILVPALGGLIAGLMIKYGSSRIIGHGIPEAIESVLLGKSKIQPKVGVLKALSAAFTIGSGQPFGAEGPIIQTGGSFGSMIGQLISVTGSERRILLSCGAAAGMAATFGTPISAVFLVIELLLFEFRVKSLVPVAIASAIGAWMHIYLISPKPLFSTPVYSFGGLTTLPFYLVLGLLSGIAGSLLSRGLYKTEDLFRKLPLAQPWLPTLGGLAVGVIGFLIPQILGVGYDVITSLIDSKVTLELALLILVAKAAAWVLSMGSQTSGGTLAPLFMIGSALGLVFGIGVVAAFPQVGVVPGVFAIAAMAAVFGTASRAPFASIVFALEVTQAYQGVLPVMVTVVIAELVGEYLMADSIMTEKLARRGLRVRHIYEFNPLRQIRVSSIMSPLISVNANDRVAEVFKLINQPNNILASKKRLVVLKDGVAVGILDRAQLYQEASNADPEITMMQVASKSFLTIRAEEFGFEALRIMSLNDTPFLIVVEKSGKAVGYISRGDLIKTQKDKIADDTILEQGFFASVFQ
ncbi:MAG TPA: chloride channel protein [Candidatus Dormibacteraeota bacterium]|nr:chloride channel protein [Candidatus Dormibacteraeota bacterium]